jgi:hypothetical protein
MDNFSACTKGDTMNNNSSHGNRSEKRAILPLCAALIFRMLLMFWFTALSLLIVVLYGLRAGWSAPRQWSDGFCIAALIQVMIALISLMGTPGEAYYAASVRYVPNGSINETFQHLLLDILHMKKFGVRAFVGGLLTFLISAVLLWD